MRPVTPALLLAQPALVQPVAPWCSSLDNLELGILLLAQPWLADEGLRRAELQDRLEQLAGDLPFGPLYFQRVSRAAAALEGRGQLEGHGGGRDRRYRTTVARLGALILNLQVLRADPTVDGSEFELKRALVALWSTLVQRLAASPAARREVESSPEMDDLLGALSRLEVWGQPVITGEVVDAGFDLLRLIRTQRERLDELEAQARRRQSAAAARSRLVEPRPSRRPRTAAGVPRAVALAGRGAGGAPSGLGGAAALLRYRAYRRYLDDI